MRTPFLAAAVLCACACAPRVIKLPISPRPAKVGTFKLGVNGRSQVLDYEAVPSGKTKGKGSGFKVSGFGKDSATVTENVTITRSGQPLFTAVCDRRLTTASFRSARHGLTCSANGFSLQVEEPSNDDFRGGARVGAVDFELRSTDQLESGGVPQYPTGFHLLRAGRWLGSFEYVQRGDVYLARDLAPDEREAALIAMVVVQSTDRFFAFDP
jgi:hypothetical protein